LFCLIFNTDLEIIENYQAYTVIKNNTNYKLNNKILYNSNFLNFQKLRPEYVFIIFK